MLNLESAEELARLTGNCIVKGLVVRHRNELTALADQRLIGLLADYIEEAHEGTRAELKAALAVDKKPAVQLAYLNELRQLLDNDILSPVLRETATLKQELRQETQHTNPAVITAANALFTVALFQIQAICLFAGRAPEFTLAQRKKVGQLYVIATGADEKINDILREAERQIRYLSLAQQSATEESVLSSSETLVTENLATNEREASLIGLLSFGIQPNKIAELITQTLFGPGSDKPLKNPSLRAYAITYALKHHKVIKVPNPEFAALIGKVWGVPVGPRRNNQGPVWHDLFEPLRDDVLRIKTNAKAREQKP